MRDVYPTWRVGIDTGGTFADLVAMPPDGRPARVTKVPRDAGPRRLAEALLKLGVAGDALVVHGTTHVTNAVLEARFARTALVTTRGFGDVLRIGRQARDHLYALDRPARMAAIVGPELTFELDERCRPDGTVVRPIDDAQLAELVAWARALEVEAVAVCLLHAYANPTPRATGRRGARRARRRVAVARSLRRSARVRASGSDGPQRRIAGRHPGAISTGWKRRSTRRSQARGCSSCSPPAEWCRRLPPQRCPWRR